MRIIDFYKVKEVYGPIVNTILTLKKDNRINDLHKYVNGMNDFQYGFTLALYYVGMLGIEEGSSKEEYLRLSLDNLKGINREFCKFFEARYEVLEENLNRGLIIFSENNY
ncbi:hypothetical protein [Clostridium botulinum]|uniref:hypothetical protein n=1 Tax=Clostridium botulinum TaxID=1491 RepID=UPI000774C0F3|nr:hypothetical protein [Clostridium botulinum]NFN46903.1 hypothetical protein [Clostridium botulinum]